MTYADTRLALRGHWGCGCDMAACDVRESRGFRDDGTTVGLVLDCMTHGLRSWVTRGVDGDSDEALSQAAVRFLDEAHEEHCR